MISVWHWLLDGRPTTIMYCKPKKEVWYNGYLLDTYVSNFCQLTGLIIDY